MSIFSIQCRLVATEAERKQIWLMMAGCYTPLINRLLKEIAGHPDFPEWKAQGSLPAKELAVIIEQVRKQSPFTDLPGRWFTSAQHQVVNVYKAWFKGYQRLLRKLSGQQYWLAMLQSDDVLAQQAGVSLVNLQERARVLLKQGSADWFKSHREADDELTRSAIAYLLKHHRQIAQHPENLQLLARRRREVEIKIERLQIQLESNLPSGRDLTNNDYTQALHNAIDSGFETDEDFRQWQAHLTSQPKTLPFPVSYYSNTDINWLKNDQGRLCVKLNGLGKRTFKIYCDRQQLPLFERFYADQQIFKKNRDQFSQALFTLRSITLRWGKGDRQGEPWQSNYLYLNCSFEALLWTEQGTAIICQEKFKKTQQILAKLREQPSLTSGQQQYQQRQESVLRGLQGQYPRPQRRLYEGKAHLIVGVSLDIHQIISVVLFDAVKQHIVTGVSVKQILGQDYHLLRHLQYKKHRNIRHRRLAQQKGTQVVIHEQPLAIQVERLIAKAVIDFAQQNLAASIALPKIRDIKETIQAQIQARAEQHIPDSKNLQRQYAKQYRMNAHHWSCKRLLDAIRSRATKQGITTEEGLWRRGYYGIEQAKEVALSAYALRSVVEASLPPKDLYLEN